jgi:hypothetical protein
MIFYISLFMKLKEIKIQKVNGSYFCCIPKILAKMMDLEQGVIVAWYMDDIDHKTLILRKKDDKSV